MKTEDNLSQAFVEKHPEEAGRILERFSMEALTRFLSGLPTDVAAPVFPWLSPMLGAETLMRLETETACGILEHLSIHQAAGFLRLMVPEMKDRLLASLSTKTVQPLRTLLQFPEGTAGSLMDPQVTTLPLHLSVGEGLSQLRRFRQYLIYYVYIVDPSQVLVGVTTLRELMLADPKVSLSQMMKSPVNSISAHTDRMGVMHHPGWQKFHKIPVVNKRGHLLGVLRYKTFRHLESRKGSPDLMNSALDAAVRLSELYWVYLLEIASGANRMMRKVNQ